MQNQTLARRYATAVFRLAELAKAVDAVGNGLASATDVIYGSDDVRRFYLSPVFERKRKEALLLEAFEGKLHEVALHTLLLLVRKRREALLPAIVREFGKLALAASGREPLEILSARALSAGDVAAMVARLERSYGKHFAVASTPACSAASASRWAIAASTARSPGASTSSPVTSPLPPTSPNNPTPDGLQL
jgi:F-type H+-transporting ATPase subunit delta